MNQIEISVIMSVFNEQASLDRTMQSILDQEGVNLELIVVNDGSVDNSRKILENYAKKDPRITLINQQNQGITQALVNGCKQAKGQLIARQDAGDWSLSGRLKAQLEVFATRSSVVLCSTGSRYFSERGEQLFEASLSADEASKGLKANSLDCIKGPSHHGCTMFRRNAYEKCGGYRTAFIVAQDLDLWTRLASLGDHVALTDMYYEVVLRKNSITTKQRKSQEISRKHIFECSQLRNSVGNDAGHIDKLADKISHLTSNDTDNTLEYNYFVGSILLTKKAQRSRYYFLQVLKTKPWHLKSWGKLLASYF
ncbi:MAG: glycosyltransferase involved in cell wall biosynthesis [Chitinophagales bacterium]|jgi:glycosyltransferase involved in cell wall biosynthesis